MFDTLPALTSADIERAVESLVVDGFFLLLVDPSGVFLALRAKPRYEIDIMALRFVNKQPIAMALTPEEAEKVAAWGDVNLTLLCSTWATMAQASTRR